MISNEQIERAEREFVANAAASFEVARDAERELERYTYAIRSPGEWYDPAKRQRLLEAFNDADYMAESRAWILNLIREAKDG